MKIHFLRHALASGMSLTGRGIDRELVEEGLIQANALVEELEKINPLKIICSEGLRAKQTILPFLNNHPDTEIIYLEALYLSSFIEWKAIFCEYAEDNVLFVGHNEGISDFIEFLTEEPVYLETATLVSLESTALTPEAWLNGRSNLILRFCPD